MSDPKPLWRWWVYGTKAVIITIYEGDHMPPLRVRFLSWLVQGSRWEKL